MKKETYKQAPVLLVLTLLISVNFLPISGYSQEEQSTKLEITIENINDETISIITSIPSFEFSTIDNDNVKYSLITLEEEAFTLTVGQAKLPTIRRMIEIPQGANPKIIINDVVWEDATLEELNLPEKIFPVQLPWAKNCEENEFIMDESYYNTNQNLPKEFVNILEINQIRGRRFALIEITSILYNPAMGNLKLMNSCDVTIDLQGTNMENTIEIIERYSSQTYEELFESLFPNYGYYESFAQTNRNAEGYLIIVHDDFSDEISPLASWKASMGYNTTVTLTSTIPGGVNTANIKAYILDAYNNWTIPPTYILLVGDTPQIPVYSGNGRDTDTYYVTMDGDGFADIHIGRFPADTEIHVNTMVNKTIYYEQGSFPSIDWIKNATFMASTDNYQISEGTHNYVIDTHLEPHNYSCDKLYTVTYGATTQDVHDSINAGCSLAIYSGHGSIYSWADGPPFDQDDVNSLTNENMYPFVCSHACVTGTFDVPECFGETWVRAENKGALAFWGSSINTHWTEDDIIEKRVFDAWWYDGLEKIGQMTDKGMYDAYQEFGSGMQQFIDSYNILGDASIKIWSDNPFIPDHDITVSEITIPDVVAYGELQTVSARVRNSGNNTEINIDVDFLVNGSVLDTTTIASLAKMESTIVSFPWNPLIGTYVVAIESQPIPDEYDLLNNHVNKTVQVIAAPAIEIVPTEFTFLVPTDSSDTDTLTITNLPTAYETLNYNISYDGDLGGSWISASPEIGTVAVNDSDLVTITVDTIGLSEGNYQGLIIVQSNDLDDPELTATVNLTVVYGNDMTAISVNSPTGTFSYGSYTINATVQNLGYYPQTDVLVNCSIFEGGLDSNIYFSNFSTNPTDWTITHVDGTAWTWDSSDERMEHSYGYPNSGYLDSPVLDCSGKSGINLSFWHFWQANYGGASQDGYVRGSTDGGATFPYLIDEFHHNDPSEETAVKTHDISSWANNQEQVMIRFDIYNDNDWYWRIDDFNVTAEISGDLIYYSEALVDLAAYESTDILFAPNWNAYMGLYSIQIKTLLPIDEQSNNDVTAEVVSVEGPGLAFDPIGYNFGPISVNSTDSTTFDIWNIGIGTLTYSFNETSDWVQVTPLSGDSTGEHDTIGVSIDTTGLSVGDYNCNINIYTNAGNTSFNVSLTVYSGFFLNNTLKVGWNLISIPIINSMWASDLSNNITGCLSVSGWDSKNQTYKTYIVGGPPSFDFQLSDGMGYFVDVTYNTSFTSTGLPISYVNITLNTGWNLLGWYHDYNTMASSLSENITGCLSISGWDAINQTYLTYIVGGPPSFDFTIDCAKGLFVDVTEVSYWHGEG
jgi:hypothetical protein